jgi:hypothetical protein
MLTKTSTPRATAIDARVGELNVVLIKSYLRRVQQVCGLQAVTSRYVIR